MNHQPYSNSLTEPQQDSQDLLDRSTMLPRPQQPAFLLPQHQQMLEQSAISPEVVEARGYRSMSSRYDIDELLSLGFIKVQALVPGLLIPLWSVDGTLGGYQYRPDNPRNTKIKYESPKGQKNILDVPPTMRHEIRKGLQVIGVTEGAKKADALASLGIPCINVAGVWGWRGKNEDGGSTALPDWEDIAIKGNRFFLAFDSDLIFKPEVHNALSRLKQFIEGRGANRVRVLLLPPLLSGKTGVDDYIASTGATDLDLAKLAIDELPSLNGHQQAKAENVLPLADLLEMVSAFIRRYVVVTEFQLYAMALWAAHAHAIKATDTTPYISVRSAEKRSGKSRLLEVMEGIVPNPLKTDNISVAALVHSVNDGATLLLDEVDSVFGKGKASETQEAQRGILNSGYRKSGSYTRMVGQGANMESRRFNTFSPKMLSGIGKLPGTLEDRSIIIEMKRKTRHEYAERFRYRHATEQANPIREALAAWAESAIEKLQGDRPHIPDELDDRAQDGWEPLLAIAEMAGGDWPQRGRDAAIALSTGEAREDESMGVRLLADIKTAFGDKEHLFTAELLDKLNGMDDAPWGGFSDGSGMKPRKLANMLGSYGIKPKDIRVPGTENTVKKGYEIEDFCDAFSRYVGVQPRVEDNDCNSCKVLGHICSRHEAERQQADKALP